MIRIVAFLLLELAHGKIYERCELARELKFTHKAPPHQLATWVCIAEHESQYNTSIVGHLNGDGSGDHGIFQISDQYWCSPPNKGYACGLTCNELEDDDISDDFICAQRIYKEHKQISGDGFNAWAVYQPHCKGPKANRYIKDCFNDFEEPKIITTPTPVFAHGFFDTAAGRAYKEILIPTQKPAFESFLHFKSPSIIQSNDFAFTTKKPEFNSLSTPKSSFFANNRFLTSTEVPDLRFFFTPTTPSTFGQSTTTSILIPTKQTTSSNMIIFNPTASTLSNFGSTISRSSIFKLGETFSSPSREISFTPTFNTFPYQSSSVSYPPPVFIVNGVKWY